MIQASMGDAGIDAGAACDTSLSMPGPWGRDASIIFATAMSVNGFTAAFSLKITDPTIVKTPAGYSLALHDIALNYSVSVPNLVLDTVVFEVPDGYCQRGNLYTIGLCVAHDVAEGIFRDIFRGVFNDVMEDGLDQFTPHEGFFTDEVDLTVMFNELMQEVHIESAAIDGICNLINGCGGKTVQQLVSSSARVWIAVMFLMFGLLFASCFAMCCGCCAWRLAKSRQLTSSPPDPTSTVTSTASASHSTTEMARFDVNTGQPLALAPRFDVNTGQPLALAPRFDVNTGQPIGQPIAQSIAQPIAQGQLVDVPTARGTGGGHPK